MKPARHWTELLKRTLLLPVILSLLAALLVLSELPSSARAAAALEAALFTPQNARDRWRDTRTGLPFWRAGSRHAGQ
jgi:hypothetical protein